MNSPAPRHRLELREPDTYEVIGGPGRPADAIGGSLRRVFEVSPIDGDEFNLLLRKLR